MPKRYHLKTGDTSVSSPIYHQRMQLAYMLTWYNLNVTPATASI